MITNRESPASRARSVVLMLVVFSAFATGSALPQTDDVATASDAADAGQAISKQTTSGPVDVTLTLTPAAPVIGDAVTLKINVVAEENVEVLMPEFGEALDSFAIINFVPRESIDDQGRFVASQTYRLEPPQSGKQAIPPILIEYVDLRDGQQEAPEGLDAYEILTQRIDFQVQSVVIDSAAADIKDPLGPIQPPSPPQASLWPWVLAGAVLCGIGAFLLMKLSAAARRRSMKRSAYQVAKLRLDNLLKRTRDSREEIEQFYVDLSNIVRRYLEDRFDLRAPELTTEEFLTTVKDSPDLQAEHQDLLRGFLRQADLVKFARAEPSEASTQATVDAALRFLDETQEDAPLMDVDAQGNKVLGGAEVSA